MNYAKSFVSRLRGSQALSTRLGFPKLGEDWSLEITGVKMKKSYIPLEGSWLCSCLLRDEHIIVMLLFGISLVIDQCCP